MTDMESQKFFFFLIFRFSVTGEVSNLKSQFIGHRALTLFNGLINTTDI